MAILRDQCNQELDLVNNLLELQQLEAEARPLEWVAIHPSEWLSQGVAAFQERAQSREQHLQVLASPDLPAIVSDLELLTRILTELLTNACKYTPPNGTITVSAELERRAEREDSTIQLIQMRVCNTGVEIAADELPRIFDRFYRIATTDRWQQGGTGLGLGLVKKSVAYLGGYIWAESSAGETRFIIELPTSPLETNLAR
jgi:signal transduction histidine kinase